jgi:hypothetical protein
MTSELPVAGFEPDSEPRDIEGVDLDFVSAWTDEFWTRVETHDDPMVISERIARIDAYIDRCASRHLELAAAYRQAQTRAEAYDSYHAGRFMQIGVAGRYPDPHAPDWVVEIVGDTATKVSRTDAEKFAEAETTMWWRRMGNQMTPVQELEAIRRLIHEVQYRTRARLQQGSMNQTKLNAFTDALTKGVGR